MIPADATAEDLASHSERELRDAAQRLRDCDRCPATGGRCADAVGESYGPGEQPTWRGRLVGTLCDRWKLYERRSALAAIGVPQDLLGASLSAFECDYESRTRAHARCVEYVERFGPDTQRGLLLCGKSGVGKTYLAAAVLAALSERRPGIRMLFADVPRYIAALRAAIGKPADETTVDLRYRAETARLLVLDDLSAERGTEFARDELTRLVRFRAGELRPMIVTTNARTEDLEEQFGERLASRLLAVCDTVAFGGRNRRTPARRPPDDRGAAAG